MDVEGSLLKRLSSWSVELAWKLRAVLYVFITGSAARMLKRRRLTIGLTIFLTWVFLAITLLFKTHRAPVEPPDLSHNISNFFRIYRDPFFNLHQYEFTLNSNLCNTSELSTVILVHSKPDFEEKRKTIRETLGSVKRVNGTFLTIVFMLGQISNSTLQERVVEESYIHRDIVQGNFIDSYRNMTHKHVMGMHWLQGYCPRAKVIVKIDDDVIVNPYKLVEYIHSAPINSQSIHCGTSKRGRPDRDSSAKYYIPYDQFPFDTLPEYCPGFAYITSPEVYRKLYSASRDVRYLNMDDVYVTGVLALKTGVNRTDICKLINVCQHEATFSLKDFMFVLNEGGSCKREANVIWRDLVQK